MELKYDKNIYNAERNTQLARYPDYDPNFEITLWNVSFSSDYNYPNDNIGFFNQWMRRKLVPISENLMKICDNEHVRIHYREINEFDEKSLNYLCDNIKLFNILRFKGRRMSGDGEDSIITYNNHMNCDCDSFEFFSYDKYVSEFKEIENDPIKHICNNYNEFYLKSLREVYGDCNHVAEKIIITDYQDIYKYLPHIYNSHSYLYKNTKNFINDCEEWLEIIEKLRILFNKMGHDKPFWTAFLPENIRKFEEVRVLNKDGNQLFLVARSEKYFYFMSYTYS